ncbi:MAG: pyridoxamine 5'-phosphate oxidase family protein [Oscillospiraceae bacterium]|nr:pyridoxamine 5'-phosphate oxidase family protein [Oscillospiraceae bacterium]
MFRKMRRNRQLLSEKESIEILNSSTSGTLAVSGDDGYPYAVPLSYVYHDGKIFFHCAKTGHKLDAIKSNSKVSFCVIAQDKIVPEEYTTYFRSVIVFGQARIMDNDDEIRAAIKLLAEKYYPEDNEEHRNEMIEKEHAALCMVEIDIEHMTGKEAIELVKKR